LWLDLQPVDIKSRWRHNWKSAQVVNSHLVCDPTIRQPGFDLPRQQWSRLNRFRTEQGHCGVCRRKWQLTDTDLCPCGETQTMSHIVESCLLTKLNGGLSRLHSADEDAVSWLTNYGKWHAYEKKKGVKVFLKFPDVIPNIKFLKVFLLQGQWCNQRCSSSIKNEAHLIPVLHRYSTSLLVSVPYLLHTIKAHTKYSKK